jgi:hypothetical protein
MNEPKETIGDPPPKYLTRKWALITTLVALVAYFLSDHFGDQGRARAIGLAVGATITAARSRWDLRDHVWFWGTTAFLVLLHLPLILLTQWTNDDIPAPALIPYFMLDIAIMYSCIKLVEKVMNRS